MKKLLIIGNSHVGSLKRAWDGMRSTYDMDVELSFAATRGQGLLNAHIKNGVLSIENDPHAERGLVHTYGRKTLDLLKPGFDHILVYGLKLEPNFLITYDSFADRHYSEKCKEIAIGDTFRQVWGFNFARRIQQVVGFDVWMSCPMQAVNSCTPKNNSDKYSAERAAQINEAVQFVNQKVLKALHIKYLIQPLETFDINACRTMKKFARGSRRLSIGDSHDGEMHPIDDVVHMNEEFGKRFLRKFMKQVMVS